MTVYLLDADQLAVLKRVKSRLYDEMTRLTPDSRRDLANAMDAVLHSVESWGAITEGTGVPDEFQVPRLSGILDRPARPARVCECGHALDQHPDRGPCDYHGYSCDCLTWRPIPRA